MDKPTYICLYHIIVSMRRLGKRCLRPDTPLMAHASVGHLRRASLQEGPTSLVHTTESTHGGGRLAAIGTAYR